MSFKHITIGSRVSAPKGLFLDLNDSMKRKRRYICFGVVIQSVGNTEWVVKYDDGREMREKSTQVKLHTASASLLPITSVFIELY